MSKTIKLTVPGGLVGHGRTYHEVVLREPTFREYLDIGDVLERVSYPNGMSILTSNSATVDRYLQACLVEPKDPLILEQGDIDLAREVREAITNFCHLGPQARAALQKPEPTSSGDAAKADSPPAT